MATKSTKKVYPKTKFHYDSNEIRLDVGVKVAVGETWGRSSSYARTGKIVDFNDDWIYIELDANKTFKPYTPAGAIPEPERIKRMACNAKTILVLP